MNISEKLNPEQSLKIIADAINSTKENFKKYSFSFILWGWLVTIACLLNFALVNFTNIKMNYLPWAILMPLGWVISKLHLKKHINKSECVTYIDSFIKDLWKTIGIGLFVAIYVSIILQIHPTIFVLIITGIGTLTTGLLIKFKPLIYGSVFFFIFAVLSVFINSSFVLLINALAMVVGYLIPAYLLKRINV